MTVISVLRREAPNVLRPTIWEQCYWRYIPGFPHCIQSQSSLIQDSVRPERQRSSLRSVRFDNALRPLSVTNGQFSLMMSLNRPEPPGVAAVASLLAMDRTTLTAAVKPLQRRGLVKVAAHPKDRRSRLMTLTAKGRSLLVRAVPV
jgi:DNA-binding MarR family transcriptional regulator